MISALNFPHCSVAFKNLVYLNQDSNKVLLLHLVFHKTLLICINVLPLFKKCHLLVEEFGSGVLKNILHSGAGILPPCGII